MGTRFKDLQASIRAIYPALPVTSGRLSAPTIASNMHDDSGRLRCSHKRVEYCGEDEVRAGLLGPPWEVTRDPVTKLQAHALLPNWLPPSRDAGGAHTGRAEQQSQAGT